MGRFSTRRMSRRVVTPCNRLCMCIEHGQLERDDVAFLRDKLDSDCAFTNWAHEALQPFYMLHAVATVLVKQLAQEWQQLMVAQSNSGQARAP